MEALQSVELPYPPLVAPSLSTNKIHQCIVRTKEDKEAEPQSPNFDVSAALPEEDAAPSKKGGIGIDAPAAWQKKSDTAASSPSSSSTMHSAMQRAMQRRQSLRKPEVRHQEAS